MTVASKQLEVWRNFWVGQFPDVPPTDGHLRRLIRQWADRFSSENITEALKKTKKKWDAGELVEDDDENAEDVIARYARGVLNAWEEKGFNATGTPAPNPQEPMVPERLLVAERAAREAAEQKVARLQQALLNEQYQRQIDGAVV